MQARFSLSSAFVIGGAMICALALGGPVTWALAGDMRLPAEVPSDLDIWWVPQARPIPQWTGEFGGRYWFSSGRTQFDLYAPVFLSGVQVSRLTYTGLQAHSGEAFGRVEHLTGFFIKGYAGGGAITTGNLQDEDFPPFTLPYSSTNSDQRGGQLAYATIDAGWTWRGDSSKLGFFVGYNYFHQHVNALGCTQTASNPICLTAPPPQPDSVLVITDEWNWNAIRLGFNGQWRFWGGVAFELDFAWLPHAWLVGSDTHWQRVPPFTSPEGGGNSFSSVQIDALLRYQFVNGLSVGGGVRYWKVDTAFGQTFNVGDLGIPQTISFHSERWGPFVQGSYKFGELRPSRY
jgi:hypothetical protein